VRAGRLVVFAKQPRAGAVKTRMVPPLSPAEALELYARMLDDVLALSALAARALGLEAVLAVHPPGGVQEMARRAPIPFRVVAQRGRDLAERMAWAVAEAGAAARWPVLLRGSDSPMLPLEAIAEALEALREVDLAIVPDRDGGYSLIGLRRPAPRLFEHPMSTPSVAEDTRAQARHLGLTVRALAPHFDVDTVEDLRRLAEARSRGGALCPRTLAYLDQAGLWQHLRRAAHALGSD
jgi:hypothetical protein